MEWVYISIAALLMSIVNGQLTPAQHAFLQKGMNKRLNSDLEFMPRLVQMSFHDCKGRCDGCVDVRGNAENKGLDSTLAMAVNFRNDFAPQLSLADVIAFMGIEALKLGAKLANGTVTVPYSIGRIDCDSSNGLPHRDLPHANALNTVQMLSDEFGLTDREAVALMGCHSLGGGHADRSGFTGTWDAHHLRLDNGFFLNLGSGDWIPKRHENENVNSTAWTRPNSNFLMLHADMIMLKRYTVSGPVDTPSCTTMADCPNNPPASNIVFEFARDQGAFHREVGSAFTKMVNFANGQLQPVS